jgi:hypothetical protein
LSSGGEHDSTGLRAEAKLNTPLLRCASPAKRARKSGALPRRHSKTSKKREPPGSLFCLLVSDCWRFWVSASRNGAGGGAFRLCERASGDGGHARTLPFDLAPEPRCWLPAEQTELRLLVEAARRQRAVAQLRWRECLRSVSQKFSRNSKSPVKVFNHKQRKMSREIVRLCRKVGGGVEHRSAKSREPS